MSKKVSRQPHRLEMPVTVTLSALVYPEPEAGGYSAEIPALPGCYTQGETLKEVKANLSEAADAWLTAAHDEGITRLASARTSA